MTPQQIKNHRNHLNMKQDEFTDFLGMSITTMYRWESGKKKITKLESAGLMALVNRVKA